MEKDNLNSSGFDANVSGSAAYIAAQRREAERRKGEKLIYDMREEFPQLARMYEFLKNR